MRTGRHRTSRSSARSDDEVVVPHLGTGGERSQVRTRIRFRIPLAPADFTPCDAAMSAPSGLRSRSATAQARHPDAKAIQRGAAAQRPHLLAQYFRFGTRESAATVLARPFGYGPAAAGHASIHVRCACDANLNERPPQQISLSPADGTRISCGQFSSSQARVSRRKSGYPTSMSSTNNVVHRRTRAGALQSMIVTFPNRACAVRS